MATPFDDLKELSVSVGHLCPHYLYDAIRHVTRNCDMECTEHGRDCTDMPLRDSGANIAKLVNAVPMLIAQFEFIRRVYGAPNVHMERKQDSALV
jgi:hypothetical protein